ncbi:hypothetical protein CLV78_105206 [Aliiruegeria haliotis]|uniref:Uncharacterized protein n=1 Tax=Aliiruegeria haliotis TaxID=1280846 RepID=A0A2T0RPT7_9RHOB|nr:hypothetical protein [Aliiruegeria haliotis]PRY23152.1 hypothetical protein CLV78_105206 [Aliiruegeria haliotis]
MKKAQRRPLRENGKRPRTKAAWKAAVAKRLGEERAAGRGLRDPLCYGVLAAMMLDLSGDGEICGALAPVAVLLGCEEHEAGKARDKWHVAGWVSFSLGGPPARLVVRLKWPLPPMPLKPRHRHDQGPAVPVAPSRFLQ